MAPNFDMKQAVAANPVLSQQELSYYFNSFDFVNAGAVVAATAALNIYTSVGAVLTN
jgi:hypothetical protein